MIREAIIIFIGNKVLGPCKTLRNIRTYDRDIAITTVAASPYRLRVSSKVPTFYHLYRLIRFG
jgi:hypothetical protein